MKIRSAFFAVIRVGIAVALLVYLGTSGIIDWASLGRPLDAWPLTVLALLLIFGSIFVTAGRLSVLMRPHGLHLPVLSSLRLTLIGLFFNLVLPGGTGGDAVKIYYATADTRGMRTEVATIMILDRVVGMFTLLLLPALLLPCFPALVTASPVLPTLAATAAAGAAAMVVVSLVLSSKRAASSERLAGLLGRLPAGVHIARALQTLRSFRRGRRALARAVGLSLGAQVLGVLATLVIAYALRPDAFAWRMAGLIPLGFAANALPVTPGGLGVGEAAIDQLFTVAGLVGGAEVMLGWRLLMALASLPGFAFYLRGRAEFVRARAGGNNDASERGMQGPLDSPKRTETQSWSQSGEPGPDP